MGRYHFISLAKFLFLMIETILLLILPFASVYARSGCCSNHGGVVGCHAATNHQLCRDGTTSASCLCDNTTQKPIKTTPKSTKTNWGVLSAPTTTSTEPASTTVMTPPTKTAKTTQAEKLKMTGCCSGHGGVLKCDEKTGYQICKDKTHSTTCTCKKSGKKSGKKSANAKKE